MRFNLSATGLALCIVSACAFAPPSRPSFVTKVGTSFKTLQPLPKTKFFDACRLQRRSQSVATLSMLVETSGGMEELQELVEQGPTYQKQVRKSPSLWKLAGYASIPLSAALGFGLVPSRRFAAHTVGALVSGIAGAVGKSRLDALTESAAKPAIAQVIIDYGLEDPTETASQVREVQNTFGILDEDFAELCTEIYAKYLLGMVKYNPQPRTSELKELEALKTVLQLDNLQVGQAHAVATEEWYRTTCLFTPEEDLEDPEHPDRQAMDKLLFLSERALSGDTEQAFKFEMTRVAKAVKLTFNEAMERVSSVGDPFYQRALKSTRSKLGTSQVSPGMLERARKTLGVSDASAFDMHIACFNEEVREQLGRNTIDSDSSETDAANPPADIATLKFKEGATERLNQLKEILGLSDKDAEYEIAVEATPLYQATAMAAMREVLAGAKTPDAAWDEMDARRQELLLSDAASKDLVSSMVMQALGGPLEETMKFAKVNNEAATYDHLLEALEAKEALISILKKSGWEEFENEASFDETFCDPWNKQSANGFLMSADRIKLYRIFLNRSIRKSEDGRLTDDVYEQIMEVKGLLGISDDQAEIEARAVFGPELQKVLQTAMMEVTQDYTEALVENLQKQVDEVLKSYRLTETFLRELGATYYAKAVALVSGKSPGGIPTPEQSAALDSLRRLYKLTKEDTYPSHMEYFGTVYKKSVLEAMGITGIIRPEFRGSLKDLQDRLGVSEENAKEVFLEAVQEKMLPMVEWIESEMERTMLSQQQLSRRRGKDMGEDLFRSGKSASGVLGLGAEINVMSDIMNLVDFYVENDIVEKQQVGTKPITKKIPADEVGGAEKIVTEEVPVYETTYPVTALGASAIDQEMAELLYRQFVVGGFTTQGPQGARYEGAKATFGGILGLTSEKMEEINGNIGSTVYDNFISNAMRTKGVLDQQDMMFLANIQAKLGLSPEQGEKMMLESQKKVLSEEIDALMDEPTPENIKAFREKCNMMGMDLFEDVGVSKQRLTRMFESEVIPGLQNGEITVENADILTEIQESLGVDPAECETMFENVLMRLSKNAMDLIKGELMRGREDNTVDLVKNIVRYAAFVDGDLALDVDEPTAHKIFNIFEALDFTGTEPEKVASDKELLKLALRIT